MGNPIQYRNTDNPSQIGGVSHNKGGLIIMHLSLWLAPPGRTTTINALWLTPPGRTTTGGLMKTLHRIENKRCTNHRKAPEESF